MAKSRGYDLTLSRKVLRVLLVLNPIFGFFILAMLLGSFIGEAWMMRALSMHEAHEGQHLIYTMRWIMGLGLAAIPLTQVALRRLLAIVETVSAGDPFVIINAERLKTIAWTLLGLEIIHQVIGLIARVASTEAHPLDINREFSLTGWLAVLFAFVLARVFEQGAKMRDDLEGTV